MPQTTLSAWKFASPANAEIASQTLRGLARERLVIIHDVATVEWETDALQPRASHLRPITDTGALGADFWARLFSLLFFAPLLGAPAVALSRFLTDMGIDASFITRARDEITPGTSALFVMSPDAVVHEIEDALTDRIALIATSIRHS